MYEHDTNDVAAAAPVNIEHGGFVEVKLLAHIASARIPHHCGLVHRATQQRVALLVLLQREDWPLVPAQCLQAGVVTHI